MIVGFDYHETISLYPKLFKELSASILASGGEVHIISSCAEHNAKRNEKAIRHTKVPYTALHFVFEERHYQAPKLKLSKALELHLDIMIDDREDTCKLLSSHGILALKVCNFVAN